MSIFKYTLPSGAEYSVTGPAGATQAQADKIFYEQVAAGSLVGYTAGQTLTSAKSKITNFELSRLERGTAGVENITVLSIIQGLPISVTPGVTSTIQNLPIVANLPNLSNTPLKNPITEGDVILANGDNLPPQDVGVLPSYTVQKLLAQISNIVDQPADVISQDKGIGKYGFTCYQLEQAGYVKPGTSNTFFTSSPDNFVDVMSNPSVWTGVNGITGVDQLLASEDLQNNIQVQIMTLSYDSLVASGEISNTTPAPVPLSQGTVYTNSGLRTLSALTQIGTGVGSVGLLSGLLQNANSGSGILSSLLSTPITNLSTLASGAVSNINTLAGLDFNSLLGSSSTGQIGALTSVASKYGTEAAALWTKVGGLDGLGTLASTNFDSITSKLSNLSLPDINLNSISTSLTNLIPGSFSNLTGSMDILGKAGQFATNFGNPLGQLSNLGGLGSLGNLSSLNLGSLSNLGLGNLSSLNLGSLSNLGLGSLGSLANFGAVADLFGGGGDLTSGTQIAAGFNNTVNRKTVDAAFTRIVGSSKVPTPIFEYPSLPSIAERLDIAQAQTFLKDLQSPSSTSVFGQTITG